MCSPYSHPSCGTDYHMFYFLIHRKLFIFFNFFKKNIIFFTFCKFDCTLSANVLMCVGPMGLKAVLPIRTPYVGRITTFYFFLFNENCSFFQLFRGKISFFCEFEYSFSAYVLMCVGKYSEQCNSMVCDVFL